MAALLLNGKRTISLAEENYSVHKTFADIVAKVVFG